MSSPPILWYFADPMCSWCWGFSPVIEAVRAGYGERLSIALILGGLRPGTTAPMTASLRDEILHHWHEVHKMTGQSFSFDGAMPDGFIYDTEPASRAVVTVAELSPESIFSYFKSIQSAFYVGQQDVTRAETLAELATQYDIAAETFLAHFHADTAKQKTVQHFQTTQQAGVRGFPSLVIQQGDKFEFIASGCLPLESVTSQIDAWLQNKDG